MNKKEKIKDLYFNYNYTQTEIAEELNVSNQYISKILKNEPNYLEVKEQRKIANEQKMTKKQKII